MKKTVTILGESSFKDNQEIERVILSKDIKEIDDNVFNGCTSLKEVIFNTGISTYKDNILLNCTTLESITIDVLNQALVGFFDYEESNIPETFININFLSKDKASNTSKMFNNMSSHLFSINIPGSWEVVPSSYFQNNTLIKEVNIEEGITIINYYAFASCSSLQTINLSDGLIEIGNEAFSFCKSLKKIILPNSISKIGTRAFSSCESLTNIYIPNTIININNYVFYSCSSLKTINLPDNITNIGEGAFGNCYSLQFITLPKNIINIGYQAFWGCSSLATITMPKEITNIGGEAFSICSALTDVFYEGSKSNFINNVNIGTKNEQLINASFHYESNVICEYIKNEKYEYVLSTENKIYSLKCFDNSASNINLIDDFKDYEVITIKPDGFSYLKNLEIIVMPNTITKIGDRAFRGCSSLQYFNFPKYIEIIGNELFADGNNLKAISIPKSVKSIGYTIFGFSSKISEIFYGGSIEDFNKISINENNNVLFKANINYNLDVIIEYVQNDNYSYILTNANEIYSLKCLNPKIENVDLTQEFNGYSLISLSKESFCNRYNLKFITLPNTLKLIQEDAFSNDFNLHDIYYDGTEEQFKQIVIKENNERLNTTKIHYGLMVSIDEEGYSYYLTNDNVVHDLHCKYSSQEIINLSEDFKFYTIESLTVDSFEQWPSMAFIILPNSIKNISDEAFKYTSLINIIVVGENNYNNSYETYDPFEHCSIPVIEVTDNTINYIENERYSYFMIDDKCFNFKWLDKNVTSLNLNYFEISNILSLGNSAFSNCKMLSSIVLCDSIITTGYGVFSGCSALKDITLSNNLTCLKSGFFSECTSLEFVELPKECSIINGGNFSGCTSLKTLIMSSNSYIVDSSFINCPSLKEIYLIGSNNSVYFENSSSIENFDSLVFYLYSETQPVDEGNYWHYVDGQVTIW